MKIRNKIHKNAIPITCKSIDDIKALAQEMRAICLKDTDKIDEYLASETIEEVQELAESNREDIFESGHLRYLLLNGKIITVVFTLLETPQKLEWNLSLSNLNKTGPLRLDDEEALLVVNCFLGSKYEEVEPKSIWKTVRHFTQIVNTKKEN